MLCSNRDSMSTSSHSSKWAGQFPLCSAHTRLQSRSVVGLIQVADLVMSLPNVFSSFYHSYIVYCTDGGHVRCWHVDRAPPMEPGPYLSYMCCIYLTVYVKGVLLCCICMYVFLYIISSSDCSVDSITVEKNNASVGGDNVFCVSVVLYYNLSLWFLLWTQCSLKGMVRSWYTVKSNSLKRTDQYCFTCPPFSFSSHHHPEAGLCTTGLLFVLGEGYT